MTLRPSGRSFDGERAPVCQEGVELAFATLAATPARGGSGTPMPYRARRSPGGWTPGAWSARSRCRGSSRAGEPSPRSSGTASVKAHGAGGLPAPAAASPVARRGARARGGRHRVAQRARRPGLLRADAHLRDPAGQRDRRARDRRHPGRARLGRHGGGDGLRHAQLRALPRARGRCRRPRRRQGGRRGARGLDPAGQHGDRRLLRGPEPARPRGARQALYLRVHPLGLADVQDFLHARAAGSRVPRPPCPARAARSSRWVRASACCSASWPCSPRASCARAAAVPRPRSPAGRSSTRSRCRARTRWKRSGSRASCASTSTTTRPWLRTGPGRLVVVVERLDGPRERTFVER